MIHRYLSLKSWTLSTCTEVMLIHIGRCFTFMSCTVFLPPSLEQQVYWGRLCPQVLPYSGGRKAQTDFEVTKLRKEGWGLSSPLQQPGPQQQCGTYAIPCLWRQAGLDMKLQLLLSTWGCRGICSACQVTPTLTFYTIVGITLVENEGRSKSASTTPIS